MSKIMKIQINKDNNIEGCEELAVQVRAVVDGALIRFSDHITRVEVHLSDENSHESGNDDKHCVMEARLKGIQPIVVTHQAATLDQASDGDKLKKVLDGTLERLIYH